MNKKDQTKAVVVVGLLLIGLVYYITKKNQEGYRPRMSRRCGTNRKTGRRVCCRSGYRYLPHRDRCYMERWYREWRKKKRERLQARIAAERAALEAAEEAHANRTNHGTCQEAGRWYNTNNDTCTCSSGIFHTHGSRPELKMCRPCGDLLDAARRAKGLWYGEEWYKGRLRHFQYESRNGQCGKNYFLSVTGARAGCGLHLPCEWVPLSPGSSVEL